MASGLQPVSAPPRYRVQVWSFGTNFGIGSLVAEFEQGMNVGWATYANDVGEAFFTVNVNDPKLALVKTYLGKAHLRIYRETDLVWGGWFGLEYDATEADVIFYGYSYIVGLYWTESDWNKVYISTSVQTIVSDLWTRATTGVSSSLLKWCTTGTIEAPVTTSGGATAITVPKMTLYNKRLLYLLREMAAMGLSDTTNRVQYEITPAGVFNFWKNAGSDKPNIVWRYGDDKVARYRDYGMPVYRRNVIPASGAAPNTDLLRTTVQDGTDMLTYGRRSEPVFFEWVRDALELERVAKLRATKAKRDRYDLTLRFYPDTVLPIGATGAGYALLDAPHVIVKHGIVDVDAYMVVVGMQVLFVGGHEYPRALLQDKMGT
jgi:hypothetical protein